MTTQPEALRLADALDGEFVQGRISNHTGRKAAAELRRLHRECEILSIERDHARIMYENAVKLLTSIHSCMYPNAVKMEDGRVMVFRPENPHEYLQALSDRIRALPDEIAAIKAVEGEKT